MKKKVRLTESQLTSLIKKTVKRVVNENMVAPNSSLEDVIELLKELHTYMVDKADAEGEFSDINVGMRGNEESHFATDIEEAIKIIRRMAKDNTRKKSMDIPGFEGTMDDLDNLSIKK